MNTHPVENKRPHRSLRLKIWFWFLLVFIPAYSVMGYIYYRFTVDHEMKSLTGDLVRELDGISTTFDAETMQALYASEVVKNERCPPAPGTPFDDPNNGYFPDDNPLFKKHMEWIHNILQFEPDRSVYTYLKAPDEGYVILIGSSWYFTNRDESFKFCQLYKGADLSASLSGRVDRWVPYHDEYGDWISSYMPLKNKDGEVVGGVGVDVPATQITSIGDDLLRMWVTVLLGVVAISSLVAYSLTKIISKPLGNLTGLTSSVKDGGSAIDLTGFTVQRGRYEDEIDILSESLKRMIDRLNKQAVELSQSRSEMQNLVQGTIRSQENERKFISHELHDEAGQLLIVLKNSLSDILLELPGESARGAVGGFDSSSARKRLYYAIKQTEQTLGVIRDISHKIRPPLLGVGDVNLAFQDYCKEFSQLTKIEIVYEGTIVPDLPEEVAISFYRFLQETLTNAIKHSQPTRIFVRSRVDGDWIQMSVENNGQGKQAPANSKGIGILGLKERFSLLGGTVEAKRVSGGFLAVARAPLMRA